MEFTPTQVKEKPHVEWPADPNDYYSLILTDPDAPSRTDPKFREFKHWVVVNIPGNDVASGDALARPRTRDCIAMCSCCTNSRANCSSMGHASATNRATLVPSSMSPALRSIISWATRWQAPSIRLSTMTTCPYCTSRCWRIEFLCKNVRIVLLEL